MEADVSEAKLVVAASELLLPIRAEREERAAASDVWPQDSAMLPWYDQHDWADDIAAMRDPAVRVVSGFFGPVERPPAAAPSSAAAAPDGRRSVCGLRSAGTSGARAA